MLAKNIKKILFQIGGPISITSTSRNFLLITEKLLKYHEDKIDRIINEKLDFYENYNVSELYSLYWILKFIIEVLGNEEFHTVTGLNLYKEGYPLLDEIKKRMLGR